MKSRTFLAVCFLLVVSGLQFSHADVPPRLPHVKPEAAGMDAGRLALIDFVVQRGLEGDAMPGAVVLVGCQGKIVFLKAYGDRQLQPEKIAMTTDTVFDLASLTKPVATATSVM
ncbi:MAG: serine hydrolase, partial [Planctomycetaceae bacterium]|nr:serine hydrolase [Planctomycetaceae bacterium]